MANPVLNANTFTRAQGGVQTQPYAPPAGPAGYGPAFGQGPGYAQPGYGPGYAPPGYGQPGAAQGYGQPGYGPPGAPQGPDSAPAADRMTLDSVLTKTAMTIGLLVVVAGLGWLLLPLEVLLPVAIVSGLLAIICPLLVAFRRAMGPALAFVFAALEGLMLGGLSKIFELQYPGIVVQAVIGTFAAAAATLAAYHFGRVRISGKFRRILFISLLAYCGVALLNLVLNLFGVNLGFYAGVTGPVSTWAWLWAGLGVVLGVVSLIDDFQFIDEGIKAGAPAKQSWVAAYGLTVTMVYLYTHILRILSYLRR
ncbi:MAG: Bax inhibitor-1/YccA family protein [Propionibacteriaceae bacterium]|nr:Bax inhibitor-1/YccA family protein [Propionibacteriaceae bacterium]